MTSRRSEAGLTAVHAIILGILISASVFVPGFFVSAYAQNKNAAPAERKKTAVNFEDQLIQGELNKPEFFYFLQRKQFNFGRLIKFRENFLLEMKKTTEQIERKGSSQ